VDTIVGGIARVKKK